MMDVVVLTGGKGSRLKSLVKDKPKTMIEINSNIFLDILLDYLNSHGFSRFILCTGFYGDYIKKYYKDNDNNYSVEISQESFQLGTGGAVKNCETLIKSDNFILVNGDTLCKIDYTKLINFHKDKSSFVTMVSGIPDVKGDYGGIEIDKNNQVKSINSKLNQEFFNAGIYIFNKDVFKLLSTNYPYSIDNDFISSILFQKNIYLYDSQKTFIDIGTPDRLRKFRAIK